MWIEEIFSCRKGEGNMPMTDKLDIARNWLPRYTGMALDEIGDYVLLTNFAPISTSSPPASIARSATPTGRCRRPPIPMG
jgi:hypothetical protein